MLSRANAFNISVDVDSNTSIACRLASYVSSSSRASVVAARAAAERLARGSTEDEAEAAAVDAIEPIVSSLAAAAIAMADELVTREAVAA